MSAKNRTRALELAKEFNEINGGGYHDDGTPKTFDELEIETNALTNLLSSMARNESAKDLPEEEPIRWEVVQLCFTLPLGGSARFGPGRARR